MALLVANLGFNLSIEGNFTDKDENDVALIPPLTAVPRGRKGYQEWLQANVTTLHDVEYGNSFTREVVVYE